MKLKLVSDNPLSNAARLFVIAVLLMSIIALGVAFIPRVSAYTPTVANVAYNGCGTCSSTVVTTTIFQSGDTIAVMAETVNSVDGTLYTISSITSTAVSGVFTKYSSETGVCVISAAFCGGVGANQPFEVELWTGIATSSGGGQTITVTASGTVSAVLAAESFDMAFVSNIPTLLSVGSCNAVKNVDCGNPFHTGSTLSFTSGSALEIAGAASRGAAVDSPFDTAQYTANMPGIGNWGGMYSTTASSVTSPTNFPMNFAGHTGLNSGYAIIGAVFTPGTASTTFTTVANTGCLGGCLSGGNITSNYLVKNFIYFYASQNLQGAAFIDDISIQIANVYIDAPTTNFYFLVYQVAGSNPPSGGNPYNLIRTMNTSLVNDTHNFVKEVNPQATICALCYYAVGVMAISTHSNSATVTGSGISLYEDSVPTSNELQYDVTLSTPPNYFYSNTIKTDSHFDWMQTHLLFPILTITATTTTTIAANTITSTSIINQAGVQSSANAYIGLAVIATLFFIGLKFGGLAGGMFGAILGELIGIMGGFIVGPLGTVALIVTTIATLGAIYLGRAPNVGGGI